MSVVTPARLRAATWNIHHGVGQDRRLDVGRIAGVLAALDADVVALQEVDRRFAERSGRRDQAAELARALGLHLQWGPAIRRPGRTPGEPGGEYGVALLTRTPSRLVAVHPMALPGVEPRVALHAEVDLPGGAAVSAVVTHLDSGSAPARRWQAAEVAGLDVPGPAVLLADLNACPDAPELGPLAGWTDGWATAPDRHGGAWPLPGAVAGWLPPRGALGRLAGRTQPAVVPLRRVDAVLVRGGVRPVRARVVGARGSDHLPLVVDVDLPPG